MIPTIAFMILLVLVIVLLLVLPTGIQKAQKWLRVQSVQPQPKKSRSQPPANWHKTSPRSKKQKQKAYVAPVIQRKWRTPRRSSH